MQDYTDILCRFYLTIYKIYIPNV